MCLSDEFHIPSSLCEPRRTSSRDGIGFSIDQNQIGLNMAITVIGPFANQCVIVAGPRQRLIRRNAPHRGK
jgi:hypothetical protein